MVSIITNAPITDPTIRTQTSTVGEPSLGVSPSRIFFSGNWYAGESQDGGNSWSFVSPVSYLSPVPTSGGFCCDQTVIYDSSTDSLIWILQYVRNHAENVLRIAVKRGNQGNVPNNWYWWDLTPSSVESSWQNEWFDYNHAALSENYLYVGTNVFSTTGAGWTRSVILRLPLHELSAGNNLSFDYFQSTENFSLRCVQGASSTMYFGSHNTTQELRVFAWPESSSTVSKHDVAVTAWNSSRPAYSSLCPDGTDWLRRCDSRITGGWTASGEISFMWTANKNMRLERPHPHVRVVTIDAQNFNLLNEPDIWHTNHAYAYPDSSPNQEDQVGIALFRGGGSYNPSVVVGYYDRTNGQWVLKSAKQGTNGPISQKWGDYVTCRNHWDGTSWVAAGFTLEGGQTRNDVTPRYIHFQMSGQTKSIV